MAIATASLDLERYGRAPRTASPSPELEALAGCPVLAQVPAAVLEALVRGSVLRTITRGTIVASEGSTVPHVVVVARGRLRAVRRASSGREVTVEVFRQGDLIADGALAPEAALANDWEAAEATTILLIPREAFRSAASAAPELALGLAAELRTRLERSKNLAVALALSDVESRVVTALVNLGRLDGIEGAEGLLIRHRPTQQEIANQIGACRETVSRTVSDLVRRGLVAPRGKSLLLTRGLCEMAA
jgi:CRP/FNR family cyclic AMP-dependent transcriptional regulator